MADNYIVNNQAKNALVIGSEVFSRILDWNDRSTCVLFGDGAGAIVLGRYTPEAIGDYIAGPNHVLPTDRTARFSSGLNLLDYFKRSSVVECNKKNITQIGSDAVNLAYEEGLQAHALSIECRLSK